MVENNDESGGTYNTNSQIKFETSVLESNLCDYSDALIAVQEALIVPKILKQQLPQLIEIQR